MRSCGVGPGVTTDTQMHTCASNGAPLNARARTHSDTRETCQEDENEGETIISLLNCPSLPSSQIRSELVHANITNVKVTLQ